MKLFLYAIIFTGIFSACCMTGMKCDPDQDRLSFRILNSMNEQDLVFGSTKVYDKDSIQFFSINGNDTLIHWCEPMLYGVQPNDSCLVVSFNKVIHDGPVFVWLTHLDIDTLQLYSRKYDGGKCCGEYRIIHAAKYNNNDVQEMQGFSNLKK